MDVSRIFVLTPPVRVQSHWQIRQPTRESSLLLWFNVAQPLGWY